MSQNRNYPGPVRNLKQKFVIPDVTHLLSKKHAADMNHCVHHSWCFFLCSVFSPTKTTRENKHKNYNYYTPKRIWNLDSRAYPEPKELYKRFLPVSRRKKSWLFFPLQQYYSDPLLSESYSLI